MEYCYGESRLTGVQSMAGVTESRNIQEFFSSMTGNAVQTTLFSLVALFVAVPIIAVTVMGVIALAGFAGVGIAAAYTGLYDLTQGRELGRAFEGIVGSGEAPVTRPPDADVPTHVAVRFGAGNPQGL